MRKACRLSTLIDVRVVMNPWRRLTLALAIAVVGAACSPPNTSADVIDADASADARSEIALPPRWMCPDRWVPYARGGCGPAVLLCVPGGGAQPGACDGVDITTPQSVRDPDGGMGTHFYRGAGGEIAGGWTPPGSPGGPPLPSWLPDGGGAGSTLDTWAPTAGIPTCPAGWRRNADGTCDAVMRTDCGRESAAVPGGLCVTTRESDCPATEYADVGAETVGAMVLHARAGADPSVADGSVARPFATIAAAAARAMDGSWILVAAGTYDESVDVRSNLHIVGQCAAHVTIHGLGTTPIVRATGASSTLDLRAVMVTGAGNGVVAENAARVQLRSVRVSRATGRGIRASGMGSSIECADVWITDSLQDPIDRSAYGVGVVAEAGANVRGTRVAITGNRWSGVSASGPGTTVSFTAIAVQDTQNASPTTGLGEAAVRSTLGASVRVEQVFVSGNFGTGILASTGDASAEVVDGVVRGGRSAGASTGEGAVARFRARVTATRVLFDSNNLTGINAGGLDTTLVMTESVIRAPQASRTGEGGHGLDVSGGALLTMRRTIVERCSDLAFRIVDIGTRVVIAESIVRDTTAGRDPQFGWALSASDDSVVDIQQSLFANNTNIGLFVQTQSSLTIADSVIRNTHAANTGILAFGVSASEGGRISMDRSVVARSSGIAMWSTTAGSLIRVTDSVVTETETVTDPAGNSLAVGLLASLRGRLDATRVTLASNRVFGVVAQDPGSAVNLLDSAVITTRVARGSTLAAAASAVIAFEGAAVHASRCWFDANDFATAWAATRGVVTLADCRARGTLRGGNGGSANALIVTDHGQLDATRLLIDSNIECGALTFDAGSTLSLRDVIIDTVIPTERGLGVGVMASAGSRVDVSRLAVIDSVGAAIASVPYEGSPATVGNAQLRGADVFVHRVRTSTIRWRMDGNTAVPIGRSVAYGVHSASTCSMDLARVAIDEGGYGFYANGTTFVLRDASITRQLDAAGVSNGEGASGVSVRLEGIVARENAVDDILRNVDLPEGTSLPAPTPVCPVQGCR